MRSGDFSNGNDVGPFGGGNGGSSNNSRRNFLVIAGRAVLSSPVLLEAYSRIGSLFVDMSDDDLVPPPPAPSSWREVEDVTIVFHGAGGQDGYTDELMTRLKDRQKDVGGDAKSRPTSRHSYIVDWSAHSTNLFQASYNGEKIGRDLARRLLRQQPGIKTIHLIGISVGAFAANAAASEIKRGTAPDGRTASAAAAAPPFVQLTLLDPFTQRGIFGWGYGNRNFGRTADYTEQFLNTDDPVPSTNAPLQYAVCYDVTGLRPADIFGHDWPLVYYARSKTVGHLRLGGERQRREAGTVLKLE